jgi:YebC/PmpR family DNA-binding regulatory protein
MKEVISAVKQGGADLKTNSKLRAAILKAKEANLPSENIDRYIKKAASSDQQDFSDITYELYGYGGVGIIVEGITDNKNRFASDIRIATNKCGGTVATPGAVSYNFDRKGVIRIPKAAAKEDDLFLLIMEAGADDFCVDEDCFVVMTAVESFPTVKEAIERAHIKFDEAALEMVPKIYVEVSEEDGHKNLALIERLENLDDVDAVFHNMK